MTEKNGSLAGWFDTVKHLLPGDHIHDRSTLHEKAPPLTTFSIKRDAQVKRERKAAAARALAIRLKAPK